MKFPVGEKKKRENLDHLRPTLPQKNQKLAKCGLAKFGQQKLAKFGQIRMAKSGLAKFGRDRKIYAGSAFAIGLSTFYPSIPGV